MAKYADVIIARVLRGTCNCESCRAIRKEVLMGRSE